jgi:hypothetical protein
MPTVCRFISSNLEFKEEPAEEATRGIGNKVRVLWDPRDARFHSFAGFLACIFIFRVSALVQSRKSRDSLQAPRLQLCCTSISG